MDLRIDKGDILARLLSNAVHRAEVVSGNIANANTPGYQRKVLRFEDLLRDTLRGSGDPAAVEPRLEVDALTPARPDGNNVNLELEMNSLRENRLLYESYAAILGAKFEMLRSSIESGR